MQHSTIQIAGQVYPLISVNTVIVGTGAASLNCAVQLEQRLHGPAHHHRAAGRRHVEQYRERQADLLQAFLSGVGGRIVRARWRPVCSTAAACMAISR